MIFVVRERTLSSKYTTAHIARAARARQSRFCYIPVAFYQAAVNWASGTKNTIREIACHSTTGQGFCRFKIF